METADIIQTVLTAITAIGVIAAFWQLRETRKVAFGNFLLHLDELLMQYGDIAGKLSEVGKWNLDSSGPEKEIDWVRVIDYMGVLEHVNILIDEGHLTEPVAERLYAYRLEDIVNNSIILNQELLKDGKKNRRWEDFWALCDRLNISVPGINGTEWA